MFCPNCGKWFHGNKLTYPYCGVLKVLLLVKGFLAAQELCPQKQFCPQTPAPAF